MPRRHCTIREKCRIIDEASKENASELAARHRLHVSTVYRYIKEKARLFDKCERFSPKLTKVSTKSLSFNAEVLRFLDQCREQGVPLTHMVILSMAKKFAPQFDRDIDSITEK